MGLLSCELSSDMKKSGIKNNWLCCDYLSIAYIGYLGSQAVEFLMLTEYG